MAQQVVDRLEAVEIEKQQRHLPLLALGHRDQLPESLQQQMPVRQSGQGVVEGLLPDLLILFPALGGIAEHRQIAPGLTGQAMNAGDAYGLQIGLAVFATAPALTGPLTLGIRFLRNGRNQDIARRPGRLNLDKIHPDRFDGAVTGELDESRIDPQDAIVSVGDDDRVSRMVKHAGRQLQLDFGVLQWGHIADMDKETRDAACCVKVGHVMGQRGDPDASRVDHFALKTLGLAGQRRLSAGQIRCE